MTTVTAGDARSFLAEEIRVSANIRSTRLVDALASIPRERFLPPGPWLIRGVGDVAGPPRQTDDADPRHVYHDVAIALDPERNLYNGQPSLIARWLDELALAPGEHVLHIGCGAGYFTALIAHVVGETGRVDAIDVDADLADRARIAVSNQPWVHVRHSNGSTGLPSNVNAIVVHAGATHVIDAWLDALADGGRLLVPMTAEFPGMPAGIGKGLMLLITRSNAEWSARLLPSMPVAIYSLKDLRDDAIGATLGRAMTNGTLMAIRRVRRDTHDVGPSCVVHATTCCLSG
jgi:protein-L-isoaspartate(D-aspartate) O-methyltransferase